MERAGARRRDIRFYSAKNDSVLCVHTQSARDYAKLLEADDEVRSYEPCRPWDQALYNNVNPISIRKSYLDTLWASDFFITYADGSTGIVELATEEQFQKRALVERLELSRRYWANLDVSRWRVYIVGGDAS